MKQIINPYMPLSEHFTHGEMLSSQKATEKGIPNTPREKHITAMKNLAVRCLEPTRQHFGLPILVTSGFRSVLLNTEVKGASNSQHLAGEAADITKYGLFVIDGSRFTSLWMQQLYSKDAAKLLHSRAYLLMRAEDIDIEKEKKKKCVSLGDTHSQFETLRAGRRHARTRCPPQNVTNRPAIHYFSLAETLRFVMRFVTFRQRDFG